MYIGTLRLFSVGTLRLFSVGTLRLFSVGTLRLFFRLLICLYHAYSLNVYTMSKKCPSGNKENLFFRIRILKIKK